MTCETVRVSDFNQRQCSALATHIEGFDVCVHNSLLVQVLQAQENLTEHGASRVKAEHFLHEDGEQISISFFHDDPLIVASEAELRRVASPKLAQLLAVA